MLVTFIPFQWPKKEKRKEKKKQAKTCISENLEQYFSAKSSPHLPT
jgi:hypothetical protein